MPNFDYGSIQVNIDAVIKAQGLPMGRVAKYAMMERTQLSHYCGDTLQRVDLEILAKLCYVLNCTVSDLLVYCPPEKSAAKKTQ